MRMTSRPLRRFAAHAAAVGVLAVVGLGLTLATAGAAQAAPTMPAASVPADNGCGDDTREDDWAWWKDPKPRPCYRYTFDQGTDDGAVPGQPPQDAGQGAGGGDRPQPMDAGQGGGGGAAAGDSAADNGGAANSGGTGQQGGFVPVAPAPRTGPEQTSGTPTGSDVAAPVAVQESPDAADGPPATPDPGASAEAQAAGIDLTGGGPQPRTLLPWLPAGAFWGAIAVLIAGLGALTAYFIRRD